MLLSFYKTATIIPHRVQKFLTLMHDESINEKEQYTMKQIDPRRDEIPLLRGPGCRYYIGPTLISLHMMANAVFHFTLQLRYEIEHNSYIREQTNSRHNSTSHR